MSRATGCMNPDSDDDPDDPIECEDPEVLKTVKAGDYIKWKFHGSIFPALVKQVLKSKAGFKVVNMRPTE